VGSARSILRRENSRTPVHAFEVFRHTVLVALCLRLVVFSQYFTTFVKQVLERFVCQYIAYHCVILDFRREVDEKFSLLSCYAASSGLGLKMGPIGCREPSVSYCHNSQDNSPE
jgi:hypothetical protein